MSTPCLRLRPPALSGIAAAALLAALPLHAQELVRPEGWQVRFDREGQTEADLEMFVAMPPGWHITTGPSGIFWDPATTAEGTYRAELDVFLFDPGDLQEGFGIVFGGTGLGGPDQAYGYFLIREGGQFIVKRRAGDEAPTVVPWTEAGSIRSFGDRGEGESSVLNHLAVEVRTDRVHFFVNGVEVAAVDRSEVPVEGVVGIRVNHRLNLHVSRLEVSPAGG